MEYKAFIRFIIPTNIMSEDLFWCRINRNTIILIVQMTFLLIYKNVNILNIFWYIEFLCLKTYQANNSAFSTPWKTNYSMPFLMWSNVIFWSFFSFASSIKKMWIWWIWCKYKNGWYIEILWFCYYITRSCIFYQHFSIKTIYMAIKLLDQIFLISVIC